MANTLDPNAIVGDPEAQRLARLAAMQRATQTSWSGSDVNPTNSSARPDMGTVAATTPTPTSSWSGSDLNPTNSSFSPSTDQLAAMRRSIAEGDAANAARRAAPSPSFAPTSWSGSDVNPTNSSLRPDMNTVRSASTGGSLPVTTTSQPPTTIPTSTPSVIPTSTTAITSTPSTTTGATTGTDNSATTSSWANMLQGIRDQKAPVDSTATTGTGTTSTGTDTTSTGAGSGSSGSGGSLGDLTSSITNQLQQIQSGLSSPGTSSDVTGVYLSQSQAILAMLDDQEKQMRADAETQGTTIDPATQFTIDQMRKTLEENMKTTRENLNSRGLNDSGILLELQNRLQKGNASDEAGLLATRLSKLQDDLQAGLTNIRSQKVSTMGQFGLAASNAQSTADENSKRIAYDREQAALQGMLQLRGQQSASEDSAMNRAATAANQASSQQFSGSQNALSLAEQQRQYNETFGMNKAKYNQDFAYNSQNDAMNRAASAAKASAASVPQINNPYGGTTKTPGVSAQMTNQAIAALTNATSRTQAVNDFNQAQGALNDQGVDLQSVQDAIDKKWPQANPRGTQTVGGSI